MASTCTETLAQLLLDVFFRNAAEATNFFLTLVTSAAAVGTDTATMSELTEIANGNGYDGATNHGLSIARNSTDFDSLALDDGNNLYAIQMANKAWTASGGPIPASGSGARWAVLSDDNATFGSRKVLVGFDLVSDRTVSEGQSLTLVDPEVRLDVG